MITNRVFAAPVSKIRHIITAFALCLAVIASAVGTAPVTAPAAAATTAGPSVNMLRTWAFKMLDQMNHERVRNHIHSLSMVGSLRVSASAHDGRMAAYNQMSHRLPGEPDLAPRIVAAGYSPWCYVAENVAWTTDISWDGSLGVSYLQNYMYTEKAPDNGHRLNILNPKLHNVGITIIYNSSERKIWITQDFGSQSC